MSKNKQHLHRVVALGAHVDVEIALVRGALDGAVEIELVGGARARELAQAPQRHFDVASAELDLVVEVLELALVPHLDGAAMTASVLADADAFRVVAVSPKGRRAGGADPLVAALVALLLLGQPLAQGFHQLVEPAHGLDLLLLFFGQVLLGKFAQPFLRDLGLDGVAHQFEALEHVAEHAVELVEVALVLHQRRARQIIEVLHPAPGEVLLHRLHEGEVFA